MSTENLSRDLCCLALDLAGKGEGIGLALDIAREFASETIPDQPAARTALAAWGVPFEPGPNGSQLIGSYRTLKIVLPPGWSFTQRGGGGHNELLDNRGAARLRWHVHGWDPVSLSIDGRFSVRVVDISASEAIAHALDGTTVIHTIPIRYSTPRLFRQSGKETWWTNGYEEDGWSREQGTVNYRAEEAGRAAAYAWLDDNRPGWRDNLTSWTL